MFIQQYTTISNRATNFVKNYASQQFLIIFWFIVWRFFMPRFNAEIRFLLAQNEMLQKRVKNGIRLSPAERAELLRLGEIFNHEVDDVLTIVKPRTYKRWLKEQKVGHKPGKGGRPKNDKNIRELIQKMGRENLL